MKQLEIEVKFHITSIPALQKAIAGLHATSHGRVFEKNICFDNQEGMITEKGMLLRLRQDSRNLVTLKTKAKDKDPSFKVHNEFEVEVSDFDIMLTIFKNLGFYPSRVYEKWRETFSFNSTKILIDTLPYGDFIEIEGERTNIREIAGAIGLDWDRSIVMNYLQMFDIIRKSEKFNFRDVTFENFRDTRFDITKYVPIFVNKADHDSGFKK